MSTKIPLALATCLLAIGALAPSEVLAQIGPPPAFDNGCVQVCGISGFCMTTCDFSDIPESGDMLESTLIEDPDDCAVDLYIEREDHEWYRLRRGSCTDDWVETHSENWDWDWDYGGTDGAQYNTIQECTEQTTGITDCQACANEKLNNNSGPDAVPQWADDIDECWGENTRQKCSSFPNCNCTYCVIVGSDPEDVCASATDCPSNQA